MKTPLTEVWKHSGKNQDEENSKNGEATVSVSQSVVQSPGEMTAGVCFFN